MANDLERHITKIYGKKSSETRRDFERNYEEYKLGQMFRELRIGAGLTQEALAIRAQMKRSAISRIERENRNITIDTAERVAQALGKSLVYSFK